MPPKHTGLRPHPDWKKPKRHEDRLASVTQPPGGGLETGERFALSAAERAFYNQANNGYTMADGSRPTYTLSCVGQAWSQWATLVDPDRRRFDPFWLWDKAKASDPWSDTNPGANDGTSAVTAAEIMVKRGHRLHGGERARRRWGIERFRWVQTVDEIRASLAAGRPVILATAWYASMHGYGVTANAQGEYFAKASLREERQYMFNHCYLLEAASDSRQAFRTPNSEGDVPQRRVWLPYTLIRELIDHPDLYFEGLTAWDR